jgi:DNA polymerase-3 subunit delta'
VDQVRDLIGEIAGAPFAARRRVFVIDDAHTMNESAQNALLKSLEEPPPRSHVILVTASPQGLRQTVRSRCHLLRLGPLPGGVVTAFLAEGGRRADEAAHLGRLAGGSIGAAESLESEACATMREALLGLLERLDGLDGLGRMEAAESLEQSEDSGLLLTTLRSLLRDVAALRAGAPAVSLINADVADRLQALSAGRVGERAVALAERVGEARAALRGFAHRLLTFDLLLDALADL